MKIKLLTYSMLFLLLGAIYMPAKEATPLSMDDDLNIMKGVLEKLLNQKSSGITLGDEIDAFYLEDYGVVFRVMYATNQQFMLTDALQKKLSQIQMQKQKISEDMLEIQQKHQALRDKMDQARQNMAANIVQQNAADAVRLYQDEDHINVILDTLKTMGGKGQSREETVARIQERLRVFFDRYVAAMQNLKPKDRIAVLVEMRDWSNLNQKDSFLYGWVTVEDVTQYRENKLSKEQFAKTIEFQTYNDKTEVGQDIDIMSEIMSRGFQKKSFLSSYTNQGLYLNGYGALLFMSVPLNDYNNFGDAVDFTALLSDQSGNQGWMNQTDKTLETAQTQMALLRQKVMGLLGSYGHTLRLGPDEWVTLHVNTGPQYMMWGQTSMPAGFMIQVRQQDLNQYHSGQINLQTLENRARIKTF